MSERQHASGAHSDMAGYSPDSENKPAPIGHLEKESPGPFWPDAPCGWTESGYLQMCVFKALNVDHFNSWAATFGEPVTAMELAPDGSGYRLNTRFARFIKVPELMMQFRQVANMQTQAMLRLPVPDLRGGKPAVVSAPCSPELRQIVGSLVERAEALRTGQIDSREAGGGVGAAHFFSAARGANRYNYATFGYGRHTRIDVGRQGVPLGAPAPLRRPEPTHGP